MNRDLDRLDDILAAASDVMEFCATLDRESFESQKAVRYAILHSLTIIGEAASRLTEELRARHGQIPWRRIIAFRHRLVHGYGDVDLDLVWEIARTPARISHRLSTATRDKAMSTSLRLLTVLNILSSMLPRAERRTPRIHGPLPRLVTKPREKSGLVPELRVQVARVRAEFPEER